MLPGPRDVSKHSREMDKYGKRTKRESAKSGALLLFLEETCSKRVRRNADRNPR